MKAGLCARAVRQFHSASLRYVLILLQPNKDVNADKFRLAKDGQMLGVIKSFYLATRVTGRVL